MPARRGRTRGDHEARRIEIAEGACQAILALGLRRASLADIARELDYTTGTLQHYFRDKDELLLFAKNLLFDRAYQRAQEAAAVAEGFERLHAMVTELLPTDASTLGRWRLLAAFNGYAIGHPDLMKLQHKRNERFWRLFADQIRALQAESLVPHDVNPELESCGIVAMLDGLADQVIMNPKTWSREQIALLMRRYIDTAVPHTKTDAAARRRLGSGKPKAAA